jgi:hypothetical protein
MKRKWCGLMLCGIVGCAPYTQSKVELVAQARRGVGLVQQSHAGRQTLVDSMYDHQRRQLDMAFDADVCSRPALSADWVVEHRKAYGVGIDAIEASRSASRHVADADADNLRAIDQALTQLNRLHEHELNLPQLIGGAK